VSLVTPFVRVYGCPAVLVGRQVERARIDELLERVRRGRSGTLVVRGEPGIGKTSLLAYAAGAAADMAVVQTHGVESEAELVYSGLLDVCRPLLAHLPELPGRLAGAVRVAFGLEDGDLPDRFAIGAATLGLLAEAAESRPLLVLVDDAHWVDEPSTDALLFAARRLQADAIAVLFALRDEEGAHLDTAGLDELLLGGLSRKDAAALFVGKEIASSVAERLHTITGGNPLALVEVATTLTSAQLSGAEPLSEPVSIGLRLEHAFGRHLDRLESHDRAALVLAAASSSADLAVLADAAAMAGLDAAAFERAEDAGLVRLSTRELQFRHPLVRSVLHQSASASERRRAHRLLADAFTQARDEERAAWHAAAAAFGPDGEIARRLDAVGRDSRRRGAYVAAADAFERAAQLTEDRDQRGRRLLAAAESFWTAGRTDHARSLLEEMLPQVADELRAELVALRGQIEHSSGDAATACRLLLESAVLVEEHDAGRAVNALSLAFEAALKAGEPEMGLEVARRLRSAAARSGRGAFLARLISGVAYIVAGEQERGAALVHKALSLAKVNLGRGDEHQLHWISFAATWGLNDFDYARKLMEPEIERLRAKGNLAVLPRELTWASWIYLCCGRARQADAAAAEALSLAQASSQQAVLMTAQMLLSWLAAMRGDHEACVENAKESLALGTRLHLTQHQLIAERSLGLLALGEGRFDDAVRTLTEARSLADAQGLGAQFHALRADLVEALLRSGRSQEAAAEAATLTPSTTPNDRAITERAYALVEKDGFEARFRTALDWHGKGRDAFEEARTQLCFGERLRRERQRQEARNHLRKALTTFDLLGARPWAERAAAELAATGEHYQRRDPSATEKLTPQELHVALQVAEGKANREVAAALFLSPKTVEFHLTRIYRKLDVRSRAELVRLLASEERRERVMTPDTTG
jgi:DNA-binding CsgD family transcriptional regulator